MYRGCPFSRFISGNFENVCDWKGIGCVEGVATSIAMDMKGAMVPSLAIGWLPPGMQVVHLRDVSLVNGFAMEIFPPRTSLSLHEFMHREPIGDLPAKLL